MLPVESLKQAKLLAEQGNTQEALDLLNKSFQTIQENMPDPMDSQEKYNAAQIISGQIEVAMAEILFQEEDYHSSLPHFLSALTIFRTQPEKSEPKDVIGCSENLSKTFQAVGQKLEIQKYMMEAAEEKGKLVRRILQDMFTGAGYKVKMDVPMQNVEGKIDFLAEKGSFKKKQIRIWLVRDDTEASTLSFLAKQIKGVKYFYLLTGDPASVFMTDKSLKVVNDPSMIQM